MLTIWRRHTETCPHAAKGRNYLKCNCPIYADGGVKGRREFRKSLGTSDMARARKKAMALESPEEKVFKPLDEAVTAFLNSCRASGIAEGTFRKYRNSLDHLTAFCEKNHIDQMAELDVETIDEFRFSRPLKPITAVKELQLLRQFCEFCRDRRWMDLNPAKKIKTPHVTRNNDTEPFDREEVDAILAATHVFGRNDYERRRAYAMLLCFRYTALRLGDVATLDKDRFSWSDGRWRVFLRTDKNNKPIFLPVPELLLHALEKVPPPRGVKQAGTRYYFWNEVSKLRSLKKNVDDTLRAVFRKSGVKKAHAHRFRHTLATELLENGATFEEVADVLGNTPEVVRQHYAKWSPKRQARIDDLMQRVHSDTTYQPKLKLVK